MKYEICHVEGDHYAHVTQHAFNNDVTARIAMQWIRGHNLTAYIIEVPPDEFRPLLPGIIASFPRVMQVVVRCQQDQEAVTRAFIPWSAIRKVQFARYGQEVEFRVVKGFDEDGRPQVDIVTIF